MIRAHWPTLQPNVLVLDSRAAILNLAPLLTTLAARCGQAGAMHWLPYFLDEDVCGRRTPYLVLLLRPEVREGNSLCAEDIEAAALFFEYRLFGMRVGAVTTADAVGFNSVIAPASERTQVAVAAAQALIERGASIALATYAEDGELEGQPVLARGADVLSATRRRTAGRFLKLRESLEATLATMSKRTRTNLRYYRRRLERETGCVFVPDAVRLLAGEDLQALNAESLNPVPQEEFERRIRCAAELPGSFLCGLRAADGRWLSLAGGWRQGGTAVLHWQMNRAGLEKNSVTTAMRCVLMAHEIACGTKKLLIYGGTPHPMRHAFTQDGIVDLVIRRKGLRGAALCWASKFVAGPTPASRRGNFMASLLCDPQLEWRDGSETPTSGRSRELKTDRKTAALTPRPVRSQAL